MGALGVLNAVMEQSGTERIRVQLQVSYNIGHRQRMGDVRGTVLAGLPFMGFGGVAVCLIQKRFIQSWIIGQHVPFQFIVVVQHRVHKNASFLRDRPEWTPVKCEQIVLRVLQQLTQNGGVIQIHFLLHLAQGDAQHLRLGGQVD